ncbi:MAG TPA: hypothetical protein VJ826_14510 [Candidatus Polarisedimenticolaceae bacterium]|nr:hypothetical protein [Candidatus Polarisedimenticolaceae bacterium]
MRARTLARVASILALTILTTLALRGTQPAAAQGGNHCAHGIKPCSANRVGQPCDPNNPNLVCSAQADGSFCCLAYAP